MYTFVAATAGLISEIDRSICPKGWTIPKTGRDTNYDILLSKYGINLNSLGKNTNAPLQALPLSFVGGGRFNSTGIIDIGQGRFRTSTGVLFFDSYRLVVGNHPFSNEGINIRCVSR